MNIFLSRLHDSQIRMRNRKCCNTISSKLHTNIFLSRVRKKYFHMRKEHFHIEKEYLHIIPNSDREARTPTSRSISLYGRLAACYFISIFK